MDTADFIQKQRKQLEPFMIYLEKWLNEIRIEGEISNLTISIEKEDEQSNKLVLITTPHLMFSKKFETQIYKCKIGIAMKDETCLLRCFIEENKINNETLHKLVFSDIFSRDNWIRMKSFLENINNFVFEKDDGTPNLSWLNLDNFLEHCLYPIIPENEFGNYFTMEIEMGDEFSTKFIFEIDSKKFKLEFKMDGGTIISARYCCGKKSLYVNQFSMQNWERIKDQIIAEVLKRNEESAIPSISL